MHPREIRASFLKYFEQHGHRVVASSPLLPGDDPTLLFTNAGMNQFKDVFLGREKRDYTRAASSQKCMRVSGKHNDLDNVGPSLRHHTFFEMLGNFSFGDYFKQDAIELAWNLLTKEWGLDPSKLYVTVFKGEKGIPRDDEAHKRWLDFVPADHIGELGMADNFWAMGDTGPCGRCSEIYVDRGAGVPGSGNFIQDVESGSERFVEIWNNVFMEFERDDKGTLTPLPAPSIDTGMGLERISAVMQGTTSNYDTPLFTPLLEAIGKLSGHVYNKSMVPTDVSMRVVADHARASTFLIADGVVPSNEWRGYVLRKIMRRAMRHGRKLGMHEPFLHTLVDVLVREMGDAYPELKAGRDTIAQVIKSEEERFDAVLTSGLPRLEDVLERAAKANKVVPGDEAFKLYDSYGLPRDFIEDLAGNQGLRFDAEGFDAAMEGQRVKARAGSSFEGKKGEEFAFASDQEREALQAAGDVFEGYTDTLLKGVPVLGAVRCEEEVGGCARRRHHRLRGARPDAVLRRVGRPDFRPGLDRNRQWRPHARDGSSPAWAPACRAHIGSMRSSSGSPRATSSPPKSMRQCAMRRGAITRRRICCMRRCARCWADTSSRPARSSRRIACASTSCTSLR